MVEMFSDIPKAVTNISDIIKKIEIFDLSRDVLLPEFKIPDQFKVKEDEKDNGKRGENKYLKHLTYEVLKIDILKYLMILRKE